MNALFIYRPVGRRTLNQAILFVQKINRDHMLVTNGKVNNTHRSRSRENNQSKRVDRNVDRKRL